MNASEAIAAAVRDGVKIRKVLWPTWFYRYYSNGKWFTSDDEESSYHSIYEMSQGEWEIFKEPKLLWRRPVKLKDGQLWFTDTHWYPCKESFMKMWDKEDCWFGPWESREEPIVCDDNNYPNYVEKADV